MARQKLTPIEVRELALSAMVDERTLRRALSGLPIRGLCYERVRRALQSRRLEHLLPSGARP